MERVNDLIQRLKTALNNKQVRKICEYVLIVVLLYQSAGIRKDTLFSVKIIVLLVVTAAYAALRYEYFRDRIRIKQGVGAMALLAMFAFAACAINGFESFSTYVGVVFQYTIGFFVAAAFPYKSFRAKYLRVMTVLAVGSLVIYGIQMAAPVLLHWLPRHDNGNATTFYLDAGISAVMVAKGWLPQIVMATRNSGFCWEPGCYQAFLSIALAIVFDRCANDTEISCKDILLIVLFAVTLVTTMSFTAFALLALILLVNIKTCLRILIGLMEKNKWMKILVIVGMCAAGGLAVYVLLSRLLDMTGGGPAYTIADRFNFGEIKYIFVDQQGKLNLLGMSFDDAAALPTAYGGFANSVIYTAVCLGTPSAVLLLAMNAKTSAQFLRCKWLLFAILVTSFSTEGLMYKVFFMALAFMGLFYSSDRKKSKTEEGIIE